MANAEHTHADLASHHIEGYARAAVEAGRDGWFSVPLISHIDGNLWTGGCIDGVRLPDDFTGVISLYPWEKYTLPEGCQRVEVRLYDSADAPPADQLDEIADIALRMLAAGKTLIHCQAGLNRSGLVAALALIKLGRAPQEAIDLLRERRSPAVLCNLAFEALLLDQAASRV